MYFSILLQLETGAGEYGEIVDVPSHEVDVLYTGHAKQEGNSVAAEDLAIGVIQDEEELSMLIVGIMKYMLKITKLV